MEISGTGISTFDAKILPGWRPITKLAIKWRQLSDGNWSGLDRGSGSDTYEAKFTMRRKEADINELLDELENRRAQGEWTITLGDFEDTEKIFGENVNHSGTIAATVLSVSPRRQMSWKGWAVDVHIRATSVSLTGASAWATANLSNCEHGVKADSTWAVKGVDSYTGVFSYQDHEAVAGVFEGVFTISTANWLQMRNYIQSASGRTSDIDIGNSTGVTYPFGTRSGASNPFTSKLLEWDESQWGIGWHKVRMKFGEVI